MNRPETMPFDCGALLADFRVEDVWRLPLELGPGDTIADVREVLFETLDTISTKGPAGLLFRLRLALGALFGWDDDAAPEAMRPGSLRERYAKQKSLTPEELLPPGDKQFAPVFAHERETLDEIENATVHAGLHLGVVPSEGGAAVDMTVYVKSTGWLTRVYMAIIWPFRHLIVYPALLSAVGKRWRARPTAS